MSRLICIIALVSAYATCAFAEEPVIEIYPLDRATILANTKFDFKIEFPTVVATDDIQATINGKSLDSALGKTISYVQKEQFKPVISKAAQAEADEEAEKAKSSGGETKPQLIKTREASALIARDCVIATPGFYTVTVSDGLHSKSIRWDVYETSKKPQAKNVIIMIGDGMSVAHRTAARILSKGIERGRYNGKLAMDVMPHTSMLGTSGVDSVVTDSANSAHAYTTGHKSSNACLGVYADRTTDPFDDPRVETIAEIVRRSTKKSIGIVTTSEIQDATPGSMYAHTRKRDKTAAITEMLLAAKPDVAMGGGSAWFIPKSTKGSKRSDEKDILGQFKEAGYVCINDAAGLALASQPETKKLLGLFHSGNMEGIMDRKFLPPKKDWKYPNQPDLPEMTRAALEILSRNDEGFVLMIESALIDKFSHSLDWERAVCETIMFDQTIALVNDFAKRGDTLVLVTADHCHGIAVAGIVDDTEPAKFERDNVGKGYPNYEDANGDGYPDHFDVTKRLAVFFSNFGDHYETFRPKLDGPHSPSKKNPDKPLLQMGNDKYKNIPGAQLREGVFPRSSGGGNHAADDVILNAGGPGSERVFGFMDNTEVFRVMAEALGLAPDAK